MSVLALKDELVTILASCDKMKGIGQTGSLDARLVPGKSDIDLFVLCSEIPTQEERQACYAMLQSADFTVQMELCNGGQWGYGDVIVTEGIAIMPMYFTITEMQEYLEEVLECKHLEKDGRFYPVGRLASVSTINVLYEENDTWTILKNMVNRKSRSFFQTWFENEMRQALDEEDLGRAELRKEVLFFHQVLENALDHLLQALYAMNECYFPSRKRTKLAIDTFDIKPDQCYKRLMKMILNGASEDTMDKAIEDLHNMTQEIYDLADAKFHKNDFE
ncbi:hypothetical protein lbkm_0618 [Lachnospiraceae bacterium KM106-2]|nr:hypothetical protein lbkm_0618 [Lachnospiraceae bacterium KM106-2]